MRKEDFIKSIKEIIGIKEESSLNMLLKTSSLFKISFRRSIFLLVTFIVLFFVIGNLLFVEKQATKIVTDLTTDLNTIIIPIFAVVLTGFSIFQALANKSTLQILISVRQEDESMFVTYNKYFYGISFVYLILIIVNLILQFIFKNISSNWQLSIFPQVLNERISAVLISFYLVVIINFLIEIKSFIFNLFQIFLTSASSTGIEILKEIDKQENKK